MNVSVRASIAGAKAVRLPLSRDRRLTVLSGLAPIASSLVLSPVLTRTLGPAGFGLWATAIALVASVQLVDLGVASSLYRFMVLEHAQRGALGVRRLWVSAVGFYVVLACLSAVGVWSVHSRVDEYVAQRTVHAPLVVGCVLLLVAFTPINNASLAAMQALGHFGTSTAIVVGTQALYVCLVLAGSFSSDFGVAWVLGCQLAQMVTVTGIVTLFLRPIARPLSVEELRSILKFSRGVWVVNLTTAAVLQVPLIFVASRVAPREAGIYGFAAMITSALRNLPLMSLPPVVRSLTGTGSEIIAKGRVADVRWRKTLVAYAPVAALAVTVGMPVLGGNQYLGGILPALLLMGGYTVQLYGAIATVVARQLGRTRVEATASALGAAAHVGLLVPAVSSLGTLGPGVALILSQSLVLIPVRRQLATIMRSES